MENEAIIEDSISTPTTASVRSTPRHRWEIARDWDVASVGDLLLSTLATGAGRPR